MYYFTHYLSPVGKIMLASDHQSLKGLWIEGQKYHGKDMGIELEENHDLEILKKAKRWLDRYFDGERPQICELPISPDGSAFRKTVWEILCEIPYGQVTTYGEIAKKAAAKLGRESMSAQAVGGAVGHNPISIIIPCHRVVGTDGSLTGYAAGIEVKVRLLELEGVDMSGLYVPGHGTAL